MKNRRMIAMLALVCILSSCLIAGGALAATGKVGQKADTKQTQTTVEEQKDLLTRLLEIGSLTQKNVDDIKAYLAANPAAAESDQKGKNRKDDHQLTDKHAALKKLGTLLPEDKQNKRIISSLTDMVKKQMKKQGKNEESMEERLTQPVLDAMVSGSVITEQERDIIVMQMVKDLLEEALKAKNLSGKDYDAVQPLVQGKDAVKK